MYQHYRDTGLHQPMAQRGFGTMLAMLRGVLGMLQRLY